MRAFQSSYTSWAGEAGRAEGHAQPEAGLEMPDVEMIVGRESLCWARLREDKSSPGEASEAKYQPADSP